MREGFIEHKIAKEALIEELRGLMTEDIEEGHKVWQALTTKVIDLQKRWKEIGFSGKEHNEIYGTNSVNCLMFSSKKTGLLR